MRFFFSVMRGCILHIYNYIKAKIYHNFLFGILIGVLYLITNSSLMFKNIFLQASEKDLREQKDSVSEVKKSDSFMEEAH